MSMSGGSPSITTADLSSSFQYDEKNCTGAGKMEEFVLNSAEAADETTGEQALTRFMSSGG